MKTSGEKTLGILDWGRVPYPQACVWQEELVRMRLAGEVPDLLVLCEHPPVITLGRNAERSNIIADDEMLAARGVELHSTNRGGDVTYHGPGQLVGYPIMNLKDWKQDVAAYVRALEEVLIRSLAEIGIAAGRLDTPPAEPLPGGKLRRSTLHTGAWVTRPDGTQEKIAAIGVHLSRWVTSHGFALNVAPDLSFYELIVPCGIAGKGVTSVEQVLATGSACGAVPPPAGLPPVDVPGDGNRRADPVAENLDIRNIREIITRQFAAVFGRAAKPISTATWEAWLGAQQAAAS